MLHDRKIADVTPRDGEMPAYVALAGDALMDGWTRDRVIAALISRIRRDEGYLAYRKASGRKTGYDRQVQTDMRASALAAVWLEEGDAEQERKG